MDGIVALSAPLTRSRAWAYHQNRPRDSIPHGMRATAATAPPRGHGVSLRPQEAPVGDGQSGFGYGPGAEVEGGLR